jgi:hypothetical protein
MKRFLMLVAVAAVAGAMYVAAAPGSRQARPASAKQFAALKRKVATLSKILKTLKKDESAVKTVAADEAVVIGACMAVAVPIDQFGDAAGQTQGYHYSQTPPATSTAGDTFVTALDAADPTDTGAVWFVGGDSSCQTALTTGGALRHAAAAAGFPVRHASLPHAFVAHRP